MKLSSFLFKRVTGYVLPVAILCQTFTANAQDKKPNILVIMGDDIGMWNIGAYHRGLMAGKTPNLDKIASEGMIFTDYYAEASCTAGRANFIMGELPIRTGMTTVGQAGAKIGIPAEACTIATALKAQGYETGQFGKNHLGDLNEFLPTVHGFDDFWLSLSPGCNGRSRSPQLPTEPAQCGRATQYGSFMGYSNRRCH
jgi:arylsulfatase A-like enzyme